MCLGRLFLRGHWACLGRLFVVAEAVRTGGCKWVGWMGFSYYASTTPVRDVYVCCYFTEFDGGVGSRIAHAYNYYSFSFEISWTCRLISKELYESAWKNALTF